MSPATILAIVEAALTAAPKIEESVANAKALIDALFTAKLITADQQNALHKYVDAKQALHEQGIVPSWWKVESDPGT